MGKHIAWQAIYPYMLSEQKQISLFSENKDRQDWVQKANMTHLRVHYHSGADQTQLLEP